jgi:HEPN domain-containing protein
MPNRSRDRFEQSKHDLELARISREADSHDWACFLAQQAAEKALKALHLTHGQEAWGHVLVDLIDQLPASVEPPTKLVEKARVLDNFYLPTRYPNAHASGAPFEHYGPLQSKDAINHASEILGFVRSQMA